MNSVLQCFYHILEFTNELVKINNLIDEKKMPMTSAYLEVINNLSFSYYRSINPIKFKKIISNNELFKGNEANDSKTLVLYILETMNKEFNDNKIKIFNNNISNSIRILKNKDTQNIVETFNKQYNSLIADLFYGLKRTTYKCLSCGDSPSNYQIFNIINLPIEQTYIELYKKNNKNNEYNKNIIIDIIDCFKFEQLTKKFIGDNKIFCDKCKKMVEGESFNKIYISPKIMIIFLDRGIYNSFKCTVVFPEKLNINEFEEIKDGEYNLIGVIEHLGPSNISGHFIASCKHFDGKWYLFSDSKFSCIQDKYRQFGEPYLLFYEKK